MPTVPSTDDSKGTKRVKAEDEDEIKPKKIKKEDGGHIDMKEIPDAGSSANAPAGIHGRGSQSIKQETAKDEEDPVDLKDLPIAGPSLTQARVQEPSLDAPATQVFEMRAMILDTLSDVIMLNKLLHEMTKAPGDIDEVVVDGIASHVDYMHEIWSNLQPEFLVEDFIEYQAMSGKGAVTPAEYEAMRLDNFAQIATGKSQMLWKLAERLSGQSQLKIPIVFRTDVTADGLGQKSVLEANEGALLFRENRLPVYAKRLQLRIIARLSAIMVYNAYDARSSQTEFAKADRNRYLDVFSLAKADKDKAGYNYLINAAVDRYDFGDLEKIWLKRFKDYADFDKTFGKYKKHNDAGKERGRKALDILLLAIYALPEFIVNANVPLKQED